MLSITHYLSLHLLSGWSQVLFMRGRSPVLLGTRLWVGHSAVTLITVNCAVINSAVFWILETNRQYQPRRLGGSSRFPQGMAGGFCATTAWLFFSSVFMHTEKFKPLSANVKVKRGVWLECHLILYEGRVESVWRTLERLQKNGWLKSVVVNTWTMMRRSHEPFLPY